MDKTFSLKTLKILVSFCAQRNTIVLRYEPVQSFCVLLQTDTCRAKSEKEKALPCMTLTNTSGSAFKRLLLLHPCLMLSFRPSDHQKVPGRKSSSSRQEEQTRTGGQRYPYGRICCQLTLEHTTDIYSFLGNICSRTEDCQAGRVNNMRTSISRPHAIQVCQSHESNQQL